MDVIKKYERFHNYVLIVNKIKFIKQNFKKNYMYLNKCFIIYDDLNLYFQNVFYKNNDEFILYMNSIHKTLLYEKNNYLYYMKMFSCAY